MSWTLDSHGCAVDDDGVPLFDSQIAQAFAKKRQKDLRDAAPTLLAQLRLAHRALTNLRAFLTKHADRLPPMSLASLDIQIDEAAAAIAQAEGR
jgi:hypothetical protein